MDRGLALFDFDGTITTKDSLVEFIRYAVGTTNYYLGLARLSPMLMAYTLKLIPNNIAKERVIEYFFGGYSSEKFRELANSYALEKIDNIVRDGAVERIRYHQDRGDRVIIVSASIECWIGQWAKSQGIELIATRLEHRDGRVTGKFSTLNCYGVEKVNRIKEILNIKEYQSIDAYGDSSGDKEMLEIAHTSHYRPFRDS
jgi:HAD superfamily hydrolase (TIGR01490 family)